MRSPGNPLIAGPGTGAGHRGAYGLGLDGLPGAAALLTPVEAGDPVYNVRRAATVLPDPVEVVDDEHAVLRLSDRRSHVRADRAARTVEFHLDLDYPDEALLHPMLAGSAAVLNRWAGRDTFHAGAFVAGDRAWAVLGARGDGKSSTLGALASVGVRIVADDLLVLDGGDVRAGPAFVDLRGDAARHLEGGRPLGVIGTRERVRLGVTPAPPRMPLAGWVVLAWSADERPELVPVPLERRLALLYASRTVRLAPRDPAAFVGYAALPWFELRRARDWAVMPQVLRMLRSL